MGNRKLYLSLLRTAFLFWFLSMQLYAGSCEEETRNVYSIVQSASNAEERELGLKKYLELEHKNPFSARYAEQWLPLAFSFAPHVSRVREIIIEQLKLGSREGQVFTALGFSLQGNQLIIPTFSQFIRNYSKFVASEKIPESDTFFPGTVYANKEGTESRVFKWGEIPPEGWIEVDTEGLMAREYGSLIQKGYHPFSFGRIFHDLGHHIGFIAYPNYAKSIRDLKRFYDADTDGRITKEDKIARLSFFIESLVGIEEKHRAKVLEMLGEKFLDSQGNPRSFKELAQAIAEDGEGKIVAQINMIFSEYTKYVTFYGGAARERTRFIGPPVREMLPTVAGSARLTAADPGSSLSDLAEALASLKLSIFYHIGITPELMEKAFRTPSDKNLPESHPVFLLFSRAGVNGPVARSFAKPPKFQLVEAHRKTIKDFGLSSGNLAQWMAYVKEHHKTEEDQLGLAIKLAIVDSPVGLLNPVVDRGRDAFELANKDIAAFLRGDRVFDGTVYRNQPAQIMFKDLLTAFDVARSSGGKAKEVADAKVKALLARCCGMGTIDPYFHVIGVP